MDLLHLTHVSACASTSVAYCARYYTNMAVIMCIASCSVLSVVSFFSTLMTTYSKSYILEFKLQVLASLDCISDCESKVDSAMAPAKRGTERDLRCKRFSTRKCMRLVCYTCHALSAARFPALENNLLEWIQPVARKSMS